MSSSFTPVNRNAFDAKTGQPRRCGTGAVPDVITGLFHADPVKALVMKYLGQFVADGLAEWAMLDNGNIELRFNTGETFILADTALIRLA